MGRTELRIGQDKRRASRSDGNSRNWVSLVPYGLNEQHPNAYKDIADTIWENKDNLGYA